MKLESPIKKAPQVNLVPILDAVFLLMFVFMMALVQRVQKSELKLTLPASTVATPSTKTETTNISIGIDISGQIFIENKRVTKKELEKELDLIKLSGPIPPLILQGDRNANFGLVIEVLDLVKKMGYRNVTIETSFKKTP